MTATPQEIVKFEADRTYFQHSICDHDTVFEITVARRTAKTIWTTCGKQLRISIWRGVEQVKPHGNYSMCTIIGAEKVRDLKPTLAPNVIDFAAERAKRVAA